MFDMRFDCANDSGVLSGLAGKRVLVAGSCGPLARTVAEALSTHGARLIVHTPTDSDCDLPAVGAAADIQQLGEDLRARGADFRLLGCDFSDQGSIERFVSSAYKAYGGLDIVVTLSDCDFSVLEDDIEDVVAGVLSAPHHVHSTWADMAMSHFDGKTLIHACTVSGVETARGFAGYTVLKGAFDTMTSIQNEDGVEDRFRVHAVTADRDGDAKALRELAGAVCNLANTPQTWVSGQTLAVGGT